MKKIIIDTNALMAISEFKIDIFTELEQCCNFKYKPVVLKGTITELETIKLEQRGKFKLAANLALKIIKAKKIEVIQKEGDVDNLLIVESKKGHLVLTQDVELKKKLSKPYLTIRQKKKIMLVK